MDAIFIINEIAKKKKNTSVDKEKFTSDEGYIQIFNITYLNISIYIYIYGRCGTGCGSSRRGRPST